MTLCSSSKIDFPGGGKTIPDLLMEKAALHASKGLSYYLIDGLTDERRLFSNFERETRSIASHFYKHGLRKGNIVVYTTTRHIQQVVLCPGVWRANGIIRTVYSDESQETILQVIKESKSQWYVCDLNQAIEMQKHLIDTQQSSLPLEVIVVDPEPQPDHHFLSFQDFLNDNGEECPELEINEDDVAFIIPTSGSTGPCKGAVHSHKSARISMIHYAQCGAHNTGLTFVGTRVTHIFCALFDLGIISEGFKAVTVADMTKEKFIATVNKYKPTTVISFPSFVLSLKSSAAETYDISSVESIIVGGTTVTPETMQALTSTGNVKEVFQIYGLTECPLIATSRDFSYYPDKVTTYALPDHSVGKLAPGVSLQVRDLSDKTKVLGPLEKGEIVVKQDGLFVGYFLQPQKTVEAFVDGWLCTGDIGYYDDAGFVYVVDRLKEVFKCKGNHVHPTELESVVAQYPLVHEVCIIPVKHEEFGEVARAFVILKKRNPEVSLQSIAENIRKFANEKLPGYKQLHGGVFIREDFPKGKSGKVTRHLLDSSPDLRE